MYIYFVLVCIYSLSVYFEMKILLTRQHNITATRTRYFIGAIEPFDLSKSADWTLYVQRFEHFAKANKVTDNEKLHLILALIGATTY